MTSSSGQRVTVDREQVLAYRMRAHGLDRQQADPAELAVFALGVQDNRGSAQQAIGARLTEPVYGPELFADGRLTQLWSFRGAPHVHRTTELPALATALWPRGDSDALSRLAAERKPLNAAGVGGVDAFTEVARALRDVVRQPMPKGAVSGAVTAALPGAYSYWCRSCATTHVYGGIFQQVGVFAGVYNVPDSAPLTLGPLPDRGPVPTVAHGTEAVLRAYLTLHGPATAGEAAAYLGTTRTEVKHYWPRDLVEVDVSGRRSWLPAERLAELENPPEPPLVRLLPSLDPYLQARDRELIAPDDEVRGALWRILGNPGALLVDGEVTGVWRIRSTGRKRLDVTVQLLRALPSLARPAVETEAARIGVSRGIGEVRVNYE